MYFIKTTAAVAALGMGAVASADVVTVNRTFYNTWATARTYDFVQYAPMASSTSGVFLNGSCTLSLSDMNGNGASLTNNSNGDAIYSATIDGISVATLWASNFSYTVGQYLSGSANPVSFANLGLPAGAPQSGTMAIRLRFTVSAGDSVAFAATFTTTPAPGAAAAILATGVGGLRGSRRRRR